MQIRKTLVVNIAGRAGGLLINILIIPIYLRLVGLQGLGLIGFYTAVYGFLAIIEQVLGTVLIRESARHKYEINATKHIRDTLRTLELVCFSIAVCIALCFIFGAALIQKLFLNTADIPIEIIQNCVAMMGIAIAIQLMLSLHASLLSGIERPELSNGIIVGAALLRAALSISLLLTYDRAMTTYFCAQIAGLSIAFATSFVVTWHAIPSGDSARFKIKTLTAGGPFILPFIASTILFVAITQSDKLIVARFFSLEFVGSYYVASSLASMTWAPLGPIHVSLMPRFSSLIAEQAWAEVEKLIHLASQFLSCAIIPSAVLIVLFPDAALVVWTGQAHIATESATVLSLLAVGAAIWALSGIPNVLQLAAGLSNYGLLVNLSGLVFIPIGAWATIWFGTLGPASIVLCAALIQLAILPALVFWQLHICKIAVWFLRDIFIQAAAVFAIGFTLKIIPFNYSERLWLVGYLAGILAILTSVAIGVSVDLRANIFYGIASFRWRNKS